MANKGTKNVNRNKLIFADLILFIIAIRFLSEEKLNFDAMEKCTLPITFNNKY